MRYRQSGVTRLFRMTEMVPLILLALAAVSVAGTALANEVPVSILAARIGGHIHPSICQAKDGTLVVVYKGANVLMVARSTDDGDTWSKPLPIATSANRPAVIREVKKFEVYPGTADTLPDGRIVVTWNYIADDKATDGYYERALLYTVSSDHGRTWSEQKLIGPIDGKHLGAVRHNVLPWRDGRWLLPLRVGRPRLFSPGTGKLTVFDLLDPLGLSTNFSRYLDQPMVRYWRWGRCCCTRPTTVSTGTQSMVFPQFLTSGTMPRDAISHHWQMDECSLPGGLGMTIKVCVTIFQPMMAGHGAETAR